MIEGLKVETVGSVLWLTLDRPECKNGLTPELADAMALTIREAPKDVRAIAITGANQAFSSGLDLRVAAERGPALLEEAPEHLSRFQGLTRAVVDAPQPVVAIVDGPAVGFGCDLALSCDIRIASTRAYFQESFTRIGLIPDGGGTWLLPRLVGLSKALEMTLLAERMDAATAKSLGLIWKVVEPEVLMAEGKALAERLAAGAPMALQRVKRIMRHGLSQDFATAHAAEGQGQLECIRSEDTMEGILAFFQKRPPEFKGR